MRAGSATAVDRRALSFRGALSAIAILGFVVACSFGVLAVTLSPPSAADLEAVRLLEKLDRYGPVRSEQVVDGRRVVAVCRQGRLGAGRHRYWKAVLVRFDTGGSVLLANHRLRAVGEREIDGGRNLALVHVILAGCPRLLGHELEAALGRGDLVSAGSTLAGGVDAVGFRFRSGKDRFELFARGSDLVPLGLRLATPRYDGSSHLTLLVGEHPRAVVRG